MITAASERPIETFVFTLPRYPHAADRHEVKRVLHTSGGGGITIDRPPESAALGPLLAFSHMSDSVQTALQPFVTSSIIAHRGPHSKLQTAMGVWYATLGFCIARHTNKHASRAVPPCTAPL